MTILPNPKRIFNHMGVDRRIAAWARRAMTVRIEAQTLVGIFHSWSLLMRRFFDAVEDAAPQVFKRYTHPDGRPLWPLSPDLGRCNE